MSNKRSIDDIDVISIWPGRPYPESKVPSRIAYPSENGNKISQIQWGFKVSPGLVSYSYTKLLMDRSIPPDSLDHEALRLPKGKTAQEVCEDYLRELYQFLMRKLEKELSAEIFRRTPMEFCMTLPSIWPDQARDSMRAAASAAGFGSQGGQSLQTITESEASLIAALRPYSDHAALSPVMLDEMVLLCDCRGSTVDIGAYRIVSIKPRLTFEEIAMGVGGKCGSTAVDLNFERWLNTTFGHNYSSVPMRKRGQGSKFLDSFENVKRGFTAVDNRRYFEIGPIVMDVSDSIHYDDEEWTIKISSKDMEALFEPVVQSVLDLVEVERSW